MDIPSTSGAFLFFFFCSTASPFSEPKNRGLGERTGVCVSAREMRNAARRKRGHGPEAEGGRARGGQILDEEARGVRSPSHRCRDRPRISNARRELEEPGEGETCPNWLVPELGEKSHGVLLGLDGFDVVCARSMCVFTSMCRWFGGLAGWKGARERSGAKFDEGTNTFFYYLRWVLKGIDFTADVSFSPRGAKKEMEEIWLGPFHLWVGGCLFVPEASLTCFATCRDLFCNLLDVTHFASDPGSLLRFSFQLRFSSHCGWTKSCIT